MLRSSNVPIVRVRFPPRHDHQTSTAVIFDQQRAWDEAVRAFLRPFLQAKRLEFYDGDVSRYIYSLSIDNKEP